MDGEFACFLEAVKFGVIGGDRQDFVVLLAAVDHRHHANRPGPHKRKRIYRLLAQNQHIERVVVLRQRLRNKAVVRRIIDGRIQDAVELKQAGRLIELVFHTGAEWNFNHGGELGRQIFARDHVVPGMGHGRLSEELRRWVSRKIGCKGG